MTTVADEIRQGLEVALAYAKGDKSKGREYVVTIPERIDIKAIRKKLKMSQVRFSETFGFEVANIRNWEQGRRIPPGHARSYLRVIRNDPEAVARALGN